MFVRASQFAGGDEWISSDQQVLLNFKLHENSFLVLYYSVWYNVTWDTGHNNIAPIR